MPSWLGSRDTLARSISATIVLALLLTFSSLFLFTIRIQAAQQELSYDDGSSEFAFRAGSDVLAAVLFDAPGNVLIKTLRFFVQGEAENVRVYVLNSSQQRIFSQDFLYPGGVRWFDVDLPLELPITGQFYVGWMWLSEHPCPPCSWLAVDTNGYPRYRSYLGTIGNLILKKDIPADHGVRQENYMIRVILQEVESLGPRPVAYTDYSFAEPGPFFNQDMYFTWEDAPPKGYIYPAFQFSLQVSGGYMGVQLVDTSKKAIFSIWDTSDDSGTAQPVSDNCSRFGHEGTGTHCGIDYNWIAGREYRLRIWTLGTDATGESWTGAIYDTVTRQETTIGVIHLKSSGGYVGYGWLMHNAYTFLEYFAGPNSCEGQPYSRVLWRGPYANAGEYTASRAVVPGYNDCIRANVTTRGYPTAIQEAGTGVQRITPKGTVLWDSASRPCSISISGPSIITSGNEVISATTSSNVNKVQFFVDSQLKITDFNTPYSFSWNELQPPITYGTHTVIARGFVYDSSGNEITCDSNSLSVTMGQQQYNLRVQVREATGAGSMIPGATVLVDGSPRGTTDSNGEITLSVAQGQHTVTASKSGCTPHPGTGSWAGMVDYNMGIAIEMDCGGGSFTGSEFSATCTANDNIRCTLHYDNQLGEKAVVLFLFKKCATGLVIDHALPEVDLGTGTVHAEFDCPPSEPGSYCMSWKAYRESDENLENPVTWSKSYEEQVFSCPCGEEPAPGSGDILFDQRDQHHYSDQVFPDIDNTGTIGYSTFRTALENAGYEVNKLNSGLITNAILGNYKIVVIMPTLHNYSSSEITAIKSYVSSGGSVLILGDWAQYAPYINAVAQAFSTEFNGHRVANSTSNLNGDPFQPRIRNFGCSSPPCNHSLTHITDDIASYYMVSGTFIEAGSPDKALAWFDWSGEHTWIDQNENGYEDSGEEYRTGHGSCTVLSSLKYENGKVVFSADANFLDNSVIDEANNLQLGLNIIRWLAGSVVLSSELIFRATCPVDLAATDPDGLVVDKQRCEIPGATYTEKDLNGDGDLDDQIVIPNRKAGHYQIRVIPEPRARPTDAYTLEVSSGTQTIVLAEGAQIKDIPEEPYEFESTNMDRTILLFPGQNLLSLGLTPEDASPEVILDEISGPLDLRHWSSTTGTWETVANGRLTELGPLEGYYIWVPEDVAVVVEGMPITGDQTLMLEKAGWQQISVPYEVAWGLGAGGSITLEHAGVEKSLADAVAAGWISGTISQWDNKNKRWIKSTIADGLTLDPWTGYWIYTFVDDLTLHFSETLAMGSEYLTTTMGKKPKTDPPVPTSSPTDRVSIISSKLGLESFIAKPNPFSDEVTFTFNGAGIPETFAVTVYNMSGHLVWSEELANVTEIVWDGRNEAGMPLANGPYIYVAMITDGTDTYTGKGKVFIDR